jgi:SMC interacting uncharacterized protein involved in chromosome segregation
MIRNRALNEAKLKRGYQSWKLQKEEKEQEQKKTARLAERLETVEAELAAMKLENERLTERVRVLTDIDDPHEFCDRLKRKLLRGNC